MKYQMIKISNTMKNYLSLLFLLLCLMGCSPKELRAPNNQNPALFVDTFIGTGGHGHTYPGASQPFGMVQLSPDTRTLGWDACSGYYYSDSSIIGFSHTHLSGTGAIDYGDILMMPFSGPITNQPGTAENPDLGYRSRFSHASETGNAGYYQVALLDHQINAELTSTKRVGYHRYTYKATNTNQHLILDLKHGLGDAVITSSLKVNSKNEIEGKRISRGWAEEQHVYFVAQFSKEFSDIQLFKNDSVVTANNTEGNHLQSVLSFDPNDSTPLVVKVALSAVSVDGAKKNMQAEGKSWDFDQVKSKAIAEWDQALSVVDIDCEEEDKIKYYTALYHSFLNPNLFNDVDGQYRGVDKKIHHADHDVYTVYSLWDTFRATHPLFTLTQEKRTTDMVNTLLLKQEEGGLLPVWELAGNETGTMIGYHSIPVIADALSKNIPGIDASKALRAMVLSANQEHLGLAPYKTQGYIPAELEHESVSKQMEYAYDDWCIAQIAQQLGDSALAQQFFERAQFYKNAYDSTSGFMRPKRNGDWDAPFDPFEVTGNYTEANAWQYTWFAPHDFSGLQELMGGKAAFVKRLDELFSTTTKLSGRTQPDISGMIGQYAHGNEPSHHLAFLYNYLGEPQKTQALTNQIMAEFYTTEPDGLIGNEDCGQMSSWFNFTALGLYPVVPGKPEYNLTTPLVRGAAIQLENGKSISISTTRQGSKNQYIQKVEWNGEALQQSYISHSSLLRGGQLHFILGDDSLVWKDSGIQNPIASIDAPKISTNPIIQSQGMTFLDSMEISMVHQAGANVYYTIDGTSPTTNSTLYETPIVLHASTNLKVRAFQKDHAPSKIVVTNYIKIPFGRRISLKYPYSHIYTGNSPMALIDFIEGTENYRNGWQGFYGKNLEAIIDLNKVEKVEGVACNFFQETYNWIFLPTQLEVYTSLDGKNFEFKGRYSNKTKNSKGGSFIESFDVKFQETPAKYLKVIATNMGKCPEWHKGAGYDAWIFADEIKISTK